MKKILYLFSFLFLLQLAAPAQGDGGGRLAQKMVEYVDQKLSLSKSEAEKFNPVFLSYLKEQRSTNREFRGDKLVLQQKIVALRLNYRNQFKALIGEKRSNEVFLHEREFIKELKEVRQSRKDDLNGSAN